MKKETLEKFDKINLLWVLEKVSLGNLIRGVLFIVNAMKKCVVATAEKVKKISEEKPKVEQQKITPSTETQSQS